MAAEGSFNALQMLEDACSRHNMRLDLLVAETALWAHPEVHRRLVNQKNSAASYPGVRRVDVSKGEKRGQVIDGVRLDDNTYANRAIKVALGMHRKNLVGFECCHIWPKTCYDTRYHTAVANLVLLPRALAGLTDHNPGIQRAIQYRAFELYGWYPDGEQSPERPQDYPENWREPLADPVVPIGQIQPIPSVRPDNPAKANDDNPAPIQKIQNWANKPGSIVHSIIAVAARRTPVSRNQLVQEIEKLGISRDAYGAVASLMTNLGNNYGRVFVVDNTERLTFHPGLKEEIAKHSWIFPTSPDHP